MFGLMFSVSLGASKSFGIAALRERLELEGFCWDIAGASTGYTVWQLTRH